MKASRTALAKEIFIRQEYVFVLLIICITVFVSRLAMLMQSAYPNGLDGFFYAMEAKSFMERGHLENFSIAPVYYLAGVLAGIIKNPFVAVKICSALLSACFPLSLFFLLSAIVKKQFALLGALLTAVSPSITLMSVNYLNNMLGVVSFISFCGLGLRMKKAGWPYVLLLPAAGIMAIISHPTSAVFTFAAVVLYFTKKLTAGKKGRILVLVFFMLVFFGFLISRILGIADLERFRGVFSLKPAIPLFSAFFRRRLAAAVMFEMSAYFISAWGFAVYYCVKNRKFSVYLLLVPVFYFPFWNLNQLDMGYRLLLAVTPAGACCLVLLLEQLAFSSGYGFKAAAAKRFRLVYLLLPLIVFSAAVYHPDRDPPYDRYREIIKPIELPDDSLLIAHLGLNHVYTYYKNFRDCLNYVPEFPVPGDKLWRICYGVPFSTLQARFPEAAARGEITELDDEYALIREEIWQKFLKSEEIELRESYNNWYNPFIYRPEFIRDPDK